MKKANILYFHGKGRGHVKKYINTTKHTKIKYNCG